MKKKKPGLTRTMKAKLNRWMDLWAGMGLIQGIVSDPEIIKAIAEEMDVMGNMTKEIMEALQGETVPLEEVRKKLEEE